MKTLLLSILFSCQLFSANLEANSTIDELVDSAYHETLYGERKPAQVYHPKRDDDDKNFYYYEFCHRKLDGYLKILSKDFYKQCNEGHRFIPKLLASFGLDPRNELFVHEDLKYKYREREKVPIFEDFLNRCQSIYEDTQETAYDMVSFSYDVSFQDRNNPKLIEAPLDPNNPADKSGQWPKHYKIEKFYGNDPLECYNSGLKAMRVRDHKTNKVFFVFTGTEGDNPYPDGSPRETFDITVTSRRRPGNRKASITRTTTEVVKRNANTIDRGAWGILRGDTGKKQYETSCMRQLLRDAYDSFDNSSDVIFTGHSMGGALAQAAHHEVGAYLKSKGMEDKFNRSHSFGFNPAGGGNVYKNKTGKRVEHLLNSTNIINIGDIVSYNGKHIGELRASTVKRTKIDHVFNRHSADFHEYHENFGESFHVEKLPGLTGVLFNIDQLSRVRTQYEIDNNLQWNSDQPIPVEPPKKRRSTRIRAGGRR